MHSIFDTNSICFFFMNILLSPDCTWYFLKIARSDTIMHCNVQQRNKWKSQFSSRMAHISCNQDLNLMKKNNWCELPFTGTFVHSKTNTITYCIYYWMYLYDDSHLLVVFLSPISLYFFWVNLDRTLNLARIWVKTKKQKIP